MKIMEIFVWLLLILIAILPVSAQSIAVIGVNVVPMNKESVLRNQTVVIRNGIISEIGDLKKIKIPKNILKIDGTGKFLMPGLIDSHVHIEKDANLPLYLANGITSILNLQGRPYHLDLRERLAADKILGPRLFTSGPYIRDIYDTATAIKQVQETKAAGYDFIKIKGNWSADAYLAAIAEAKKLGIKIVGHAPRNLPFELVLQGGGENMAHMEEMVYTYAPLFEWYNSYRASNNGKLTGTEKDNPELSLELPVHQLAKSIKQKGLWVIPTMVVIDGFVRQGAEASFKELVNRSYMQYLEPTTRKNWEGSFQPKYLTQYKQLLSLEKFMLKVFRQEGVKLALGTDGEYRPVMSGFSLHQELMLMVESGLTPYEALKMGTINGAEFIGIDKELGTVEIGKKADLVLLAKNPLEDVRNAEQIEGVILKGKWLPKETLALQLKSLKDSYASLNAQVEKIDKSFNSGGAKSAVAAFKEIQPYNPEVASYVEAMINSEGYRLLGNSQMEKAIEIFLINVDTFQKSANVYDSLGEAYMMKGNIELAIKNYEKSLELNPQNTNAVQKLKELRQKK